MDMMPLGMVAFPLLLFMAVYAATAFSVIYFAGRLAIRHESSRKQ